MSGRSGSSVARHTPLVRVGAVTFALSGAQARLVRRALAAGGVVHVYGREVLPARKLASLRVAELVDDGPFGPKDTSNADGERWTLKLAADVTLEGGAP